MRLSQPCAASSSAQEEAEATQQAADSEPNFLSPGEILKGSHQVKSIALPNVNFLKKKSISRTHKECFYYCFPELPSIVESHVLKIRLLGFALMKGGHIANYRGGIRIKPIFFLN